jgi:hypothetical protein
VSRRRPAPGAVVEAAATDRAARAERRELVARARRREELHNLTRGHGATCPCDPCRELRRI